jgi:two-component system, NarL family, response regulator NreC
VRRPEDATADPATERAEPVRVVLADDHGLMRRSLRGLLDAESEVDVVAEADSPASMFRRVRALGPRVLLVGLSTSNGSSLESIRLLRIEAPATEIIVLAMDGSRAYARAALDAGAIGFVLKQAADTDLVRAVLSADRGERYVSPRLATGLDAPDGPLT